MGLKEWADREGVHYQTAWRWCRDGLMPVPFSRTPTGTIVVHVEQDTTSAGLGLYARVSSHDQKADLDRQVARLTEWAATTGRPIMVEAAVTAHGRDLVVLDDGEVDDGLVRDTVEVLTSFCARSCGRRGARNRALRAVTATKTDGTADAADGAVAPLGHPER